MESDTRQYDAIAASPILPRPCRSSAKPTTISRPVRDKSLCIRRPKNKADTICSVDVNGASNIVRMVISTNLASHRMHLHNTRAQHLGKPPQFIPRRVCGVDRNAQRLQQILHHSPDLRSLSSSLPRRTKTIFEHSSSPQLSCPRKQQKISSGLIRVGCTMRPRATLEVGVLPTQGSSRTGRKAWGKLGALQNELIGS